MTNGTRMRPNAVFSVFVQQAAKGKPITIQGSGLQGRQFIHARDIGRAFARAVDSPVRGEAFNIVAESVVTIRELAIMISELLPTEVTFGEPRPGDIAPALVSAQKAREILGWEAVVPFSEGLRELVDAQLGVETPSEGVRR